MRLEVLGYSLAGKTDALDLVVRSILGVFLVVTDSFWVKRTVGAVSGRMKFHTMIFPSKA